MSEERSPWGSIVGKAGKMQFAGAVMIPHAPGGQAEAGNVLNGRVAAVEDGVVVVDCLDKVTTKEKEYTFRLYVTPAAIISFLEVASEVDATPPSLLSLTGARR